MSDEIRITQNWSAELLREVDSVALAEVMGTSKFSFFLKFLVLPICLAVIAEYVSSFRPQAGFFLLGLPIGAVAMGVYFGFLERRVQAKFAKATLSSPIRSEPTAVTLSTEGIHASNSLVTDHIGWPAVTAVVESHLALHIMLGATNSFPIPHDALPEGVTRDDLRQRVDAWRGVKT